MIIPLTVIAVCLGLAFWSWYWIQLSKPIVEVSVKFTGDVWDAEVCTFEGGDRTRRVTGVFYTIEHAIAWADGEVERERKRVASKKSHGKKAYKKEYRL